VNLQGTINHVALAASDLDQAMQFYSPLLEALGYTVGQVMPCGESRLTVNVNEAHGTAINIWQATKEHKFDTYEPGLHHLAFNVSSSLEVDRIHKLAVDVGAEVLDGPGEFPFAHHGYYAVYFLGPDGIKIEVVHMPALEVAISKGNASTA
jgi:catechol 2,3-dioxygenase-like lactoylglutathione lyase family enzyme